MKPLIDNNMRAEWSGVFATAKARFDRLREAGVEKYGWSPNCDCVECGDTGINPEKNQPCWCEPGRVITERRHRHATWIDVEAIPTRHQGARLDTHPSSDAREVGSAWLTDGYPANKSLLLIGNTGVGKTGLAVAIAYELHLQGVPMRFHSVSIMLDRLRPGANHDPASLMHELLDTGLLVLDDLGAQKLTEFTVERITTIIDSRYGNKLPTIITSNLEIADLRDQFGERVFSRIAEMTTIAKLRGSDLRTMRLLEAQS